MRVAEGVGAKERVRGIFGGRNFGNLHKSFAPKLICEISISAERTKGRRKSFSFQKALTLYEYFPLELVVCLILHLYFLCKLK